MSYTRELVLGRVAKMTVYSQLQAIDLKLLYFVNQRMASPFFDATMPTVTGSLMWIVLGVVVVTVARLKLRTNQVLLFALLVAVCAGIADGLSFQVFKYLFSRPRPCYTFEDLRIIVGCGGTWGFPSSHATNSMAMAVFTCLVFRKWWTTIGFAVVLLVSFSRVYLGVHYPSDVLGGIALGAAVAAIVYFSIKRRQKLQFLIDPDVITGRNAASDTSIQKIQTLRTMYEPMA